MRRDQQWHCDHSGLDFIFETDSRVWPAVDAIKQQISWLDYLQTQIWKPARRISRGRLMGLCPLHFDHQPSFRVDPLKNLFYCYGCGRGGDLIRFVELYHEVGFGEAMALLRCSPPGFPPS